MIIMAAKENQRPKSSQYMMRKSKSTPETATLPFQRIHSLENKDGTKNWQTLNDLTSVPGMVRVCSGTYIINSRQSISQGTNLYVHEKVKRKVVQIKCCYPKHLCFVNIPLCSGIHVGFKYGCGIMSFQNVKDVIKQEKSPPRILCVITTCQCASKNHKPLSVSDILIVVSVKRKELLIRNVSTDETFYLPAKCSASFTTDPKRACISMYNLEMFLPIESIHQMHIVPNESLDALESLVQSLNKLVVEQYFTEECFKVQVSRSTDMHLIPLDSALEVVPVLQHLKDEFPKSDYEEIDILNQPTRTERPYLGKVECNLPLMSPPSSVLSSTSSKKASKSSLDGDVLNMPPILEDKQHSLQAEHFVPELSLLNLSHETKEVTRLFQFGMELRIPLYILENLEANFPQNVERRRMGLLSYWLNNDENLSWKAITDALLRMDEKRLSKKIQWKIGNPTEDSGKRQIPPYYEDDTDFTEEQKIKDDFKDLKKELQDMRQQLTHIENMTMFQKPSDAEHKLLSAIKQRVEIIEAKTEAYPYNINCSKLEAENTQADSLMPTQTIYKVTDAQMYYNAVLFDSHCYISKLLVSEEHIFLTELHENKARQKELELGRDACGDVLSSVTGASLHPRDVFDRCYCIRMLLNKATYNHKLAILKVEEREIKQKIVELKNATETMHTQKYNRNNGRRSSQVQVRKMDTFIRPGPIPKPRKLINRPKTSVRNTVTQSVPTPKPRRWTLVRSLSQENAYPPAVIPMVDRLPQLPASGKGNQSASCYPSRDRQKPHVPPRSNLPPRCE